MSIITLDISFQLWAALPLYKITLLCFSRKPVACETKQEWKNSNTDVDGRKQKYTNV
jgi:hypothetical protein